MAAAPGFAGWARRTFDLERPHEELVVEVARLLDRLDALAERVEADGLTVAGSVGQPRPHPLIAEHRQTALALTRVLDALGLDRPVEERPESRTTVRARRAAESRWARELPAVPRLDNHRRGRSPA